MQLFKKKFFKFYRSRIIDWETDGKKSHLIKKLKLINPNNLMSFGKKNRNKKFYLIRVEPGGGFFSIFFSILINIKLANKKRYIPFVDLENFHTKYNQKKKVRHTYNSWEYYFSKISNYNLTSIYQSKNVYFSKKNINTRDYIKDHEFRTYKKIITKYVKIDNFIKKIVENFEKKNFKDKKILGVHFRGTDMKTTPSHPFPPTFTQVTFLIDNYLNKYEYDKVFIITEQLNYLNRLKKKYKDKIIFFDSYRSNKSKIFQETSRNNHRYLLGRDILIETLLLSKTDMIISSKTNVSKAALLFSKKNKKIIYINNGINSSRFLLSQFLWSYKIIMPEFFGGFKKKIDFSS
tara:strand:- start:2290 stop:3333 length:1044 start_codon:yes stop_codon:yes gene_type:complete